MEGIIPALETAHAIAYIKKLKNVKNEDIILNLSGRGDKDINTVAKELGINLWTESEIYLKKTKISS